ncbi:MAG: radical SAM protein [Promethearchaeota archaeon]
MENLEGKKLFRRTKSVCPECMKQIDANIVLDEYEGQNAVLMRKVCPEHGFFQDLISRTPEEYERNQQYYHDPVPVENRDPSRRMIPAGCPHACGLCDQHKSSPCIALVDITNRCNLACPICFANANAKGYVVEYTLDELRTIFEHFRNIKPIPPVLLQLSGGEPTVRDDLPEIIRMGKELGFVEIMVTTNGVRMGARNGAEYIKELMDAGMHAIYLQFDSATDPEVWKKIRGHDLTKIKQRVIENCRKVGFSGVMLVPTVAKGVNDHQVKDILEFAKKNRDVVSGVVFQPVSLVGRVDSEQVRELRYTTSDLSKAIAEATGLSSTYIYPIPATSRFTQLLAWFDFAPQFTMASHPDCGFATIMVIDPKTDKWLAIEEWFDTDGLIKWADKVWEMVQKGEWPNLQEKFIGPLAKLFGEKIGSVINQASDFAYRKAMKAYFMAGAMRYLKGIDGPIREFIPLMLSPKLETAGAFFEHSNNLMVSSMHFQDGYNFDIERVSRCLVHYGVLDPNNPGKVLQIPFCAMNTLHRERIEKQLAEKRKSKIDVDPVQVQKNVAELVQRESMD